MHDHICGWFLIGRGKACKGEHRYTPHAQANSVNRLFSSRLANVRALCRFFGTTSRSHTRTPRQGFAWLGTCQQQWPRLDLGAKRARLWSHSFRTDDEVRGKKPASLSKQKKRYFSPLLHRTSARCLRSPRWFWEKQDAVAQNPTPRAPRLNPRGGRFRVGSYAGVTGARPSLVTCGQNGFLRRVQRQKFSSAKMLGSKTGSDRLECLLIQIRDFLTIPVPGPISRAVVNRIDDR